MTSHWPECSACGSFHSDASSGLDSSQNSCQLKCRYPFFFLPLLPFLFSSLSVTPSLFNFFFFLFLSLCISLCILFISFFPSLFYIFILYISSYLSSNAFNLFFFPSYFSVSLSNLLSFFNKTESMEIPKTGHMRFTSGKPKLTLGT